jgi:hypothetical protein
MAIEFRVDGTLLDPERVRMTGGSSGGVAGLPAAAFNGEPATAGVTIEDPEGDLILTGWRSFTVDETDCTTKPRIFTGWLFARSVSRGPYRTGPGRIWNCDIIDQNANWIFKIFRFNSAHRPAETDIARMAYLIDSEPMAPNPVFDNGLWNTTDNPIAFDEANYVTQTPAEMAASVAGISGKNWYAYWDDTANQISGYYDVKEATNRTSALRISNLQADVNGDPDTYYPMIDGQLVRTPEDTYSGVLYGWRGGNVYQQDTGTITTYIDRDMVYRTDRVGRLTTAEAQAASQLAAHSTEQDTITCMVRLPSSEVNFLHAGERVEVKFTHLPGYEAFSFVRILRRNVVPTAGRRDRYDVHLELSNRGPESGPGGGDPGDFPLPEPEPGSAWWSGSGSWGGPDVGFTRFAGDSPNWLEGLYSYSISIAEDPKPDSTYASEVGIFRASDNQQVLNIGRTPSPGGDGTTFTGTFSVDSSGNVTVLTHAGGGIQENTLNNNFVLGDAYYIAGSSAGNSLSGDTLCSFAISLAGFGAEPSVPVPGQRINNETPIQTSAGPPAVYQTAWPYADGSLRVFVDNLDQTAAVVETDPETGEFTLAFTPTSTERIRVYYQAR